MNICFIKFKVDYFSVTWYNKNRQNTKRRVGEAAEKAAFAMKDVTKTIRKRCEKCNKPFSTADESVSLCRECQAKADFETRRAADLDRKENAKKIAITKKCIDCGSEFTVTNGELDFLKNHGYGEPIRCPDCRALHREYVKKGMNNVGMETDCVDCGKHIKFTNRELYWYISHGYSIPTRCKDCREKRRAKFQKEQDKKVPQESNKESESPNEKQSVEPDHATESAQALTGQIAETQDSKNT